MIRLVLFLIAVLGVVMGLHWLADRPGTIVVEWQDHVAETSVFRAFVVLLVLLAAAVLAWSILRGIWTSPASLGRYLHGRRQKRGLEAISSGIIAVGAGDRLLASRYANQARKTLPNEPLTHLLRAQTAELTGDRTTSRRFFEAMLASPDTEQLGLRGLFLEAQREDEKVAARQYAERALRLNTKLDWPVEALFDIQCRDQDWPGALGTLDIARRQQLIEKAVANRRRAVLLTAMAQASEEATPQKALDFALEAHRLAPDLVPAAAISGRILASQGSTPRTARVLLKTWRLSPHPDLAAAYAYARPGDSPKDRLARVRQLGRITPNSAEGNVAVAVTAIEAREWAEARKALEPLLEGRLTQRVCTLMARIESAENGATGKVREWLARAVHAPRDPAWTADGVVSDRWAPMSPVSGQLDAFKWRVPVEAIDQAEGELLAAKVDALVTLGAAPETVIDEVEAVTVRSGRVGDGALNPAMSGASAIVQAQAEPQTTAPQRVPATAPPGPVVSAAFGDGAKPVRSQAPRIFVPPRAPDDPGTEEQELAGPEAELTEAGTVRSAQAKL